MSDLKTTGPYSMKRYQCAECGHESMIGTNHWGECYPRCSNCGWKKPLQMGQTHICLEPAPEGYGKPEPWKQVKLGDIAEIKTVRCPDHRNGGATRCPKGGAELQIWQRNQWRD